MAFDFSNEDTIAAIASAPGPSPRGILRISGPQVSECLSRCFQPRNPEFPGWHLINRASVIEGDFQLEKSLSIAGQVLYWPDHRSYTRQPSAELHLPGSLPLLNLLLQKICSGSIRAARPGEFTLRAFFSGRIDLSQAEAVLAVIDADEESQFRTALAQLSGGLAHPFAAIRSHLLDLIADIEAGLDFVDEDIEFISADSIQKILAAALQQVRQLKQQMQQRGESTAIPRVVLFGHPNTGKSSLFNCLTTGPHAIVSDVAGTTRDFLAARLTIGQQKLQLLDTAGVEQEIIDLPLPTTLDERFQFAAQTQTDQADISILCLDSTRPLSPWEARHLALDSGNRIVVETKIDLPAGRDLIPHAVKTSASCGVGINELLGQVIEKISLLNQNEMGCVLTTTVRCYESVCRTEEALLAAVEVAALRLGDELLATEVRIALDQIGQIIGVVHNEDILDRLFSRFCIGK